MRNGLEPKSHLEEKAPEYPHYEISREETAAGKAEMRRDAYEGETCKQDDKYMPDL